MRTYKGTAMGEADQMELVYSLIGFPNETEWLEFKEGNSDPKSIGKDISALANSAALMGRDFAYKIWGVEDSTHRLVGTSFDPAVKKASGNQPLSLWLRTMLSSNANYEFKTINHDGLKFVVLVIRAAQNQPVSFDRQTFIRVGSSTTQLAPGSSKEVELWKKLQTGQFELGIAMADIRHEELADHLDIEAYYELIRMRKPSSDSSVVAQLVEQELLKAQDNGRLSITNLGALLIGKRLTAYPCLQKRPLRIVRFAGRGSYEILNDIELDKGYALALQEAESVVASLIPSQEVADGAFRRVEAVFPQKAIREFISNEVIHQDLCDATCGPTVFIYDNRIEFSNPGVSLVPADRVLNAQPKTRNARLAGILRQMDLCEEGGTGWDLAVASCERRYLAAPTIESSESLGMTKVVLSAPKEFAVMSKGERLDSLYWHACLMYAQGESMNNQSLRERFGLEPERKNTVAISRLIKEAVDRGIVREEVSDAPDKYKRYIPGWA